MSKTMLRVKNWEKFQCYKDRDPKWIKLYRCLLDNYEYSQMPDEAKAHLVGIWLLAAKIGNEIPADDKWIEGRIGARSPVDLKLLESLDFIELYESVQNCTELYEKIQKPVPTSSYLILSSSSSPSVSEEGECEGDGLVAIPQEGATSPQKAARKGREQKEHISEMVARWNRLATPLGLSAVREISGVRLKHLDARMAENPDFWDVLERELPQLNDFARGIGNNGWRLSFDYCVESQSKFNKLAEGAYRKPKDPRRQEWR